MSARENEDRSILLPASRRAFLKKSGLAAATGIGAATLGGLLPEAATAATRYEPAPPPAPSPLQAVAEEAVIFGIPAVLMSRWFENTTKAGIPPNRLTVNLDLSNPATRIVGPNDDTLYGLGWLDLAEGAQVIEVPNTGGRYYSIQLNDMWGNAFFYIGSRATGTKAGAFAVTPPGFTGKVPPGITQIRATTKRVLAFVRTFVKDPGDLSAARKIHSSYTTGLLSAYPRGRVKVRIAAKAEALNVLATIDLTTSTVSIFKEINELIKQYPPLPPNAAQAKKLRPVGVDVAKYKEPSASSAAILAAAIKPAVAKAQAAGQAADTTVNGWRVRYGVQPITYNPLERASIILPGPGYHIQKEALYWGLGALNGKPLTGADNYVLRFTKEQLPPVKAFWSLVMYEPPALLLVENPIDRYEIASHTPGLQYGVDGSLEIPIQHSEPVSGTANWLPSPAGNFVLVLRTYVPKKAVLDRRWQMPPLQLA